MRGEPAARVRPVGRRVALAGGLGLAVAWGACARQSAPTAPAAARAPTLRVDPNAGAASAATTLQIIGWPFRPDLLRERLSGFEQQVPGVQVQHEQALRDYGNRALAAMQRAPGVDVVQVREGLLGWWWTGGVIRSLGDEGAWASTLDAMWPHARASVVRGGQVVALPQYSDVMVLAYNKRLLKELGAKPPRTLDELTSVCQTAVRRRLVEFPITLNLTPKVFANLPWWGLVYASGGSLLRRAGPDGITVAVLEWLRKAIAADRIVDPAFLEATYATLGLGKHVFSIIGGYGLKQLNTETPGAFDIAPIPGLAQPGGTVAWTPAYAVSAAAPHPDLAVALATFLGAGDASGGFTSASFWFRHEGLTPAYPAVLRDPGARDDVARWASVDALEAIVRTARPIEGAWDPWFLVWENETQALVQEAIFGRRTPAQALTDSHRRFLELSAQQPSR